MVTNLSLLKREISKHGMPAGDGQKGENVPRKGTLTHVPSDKKVLLTT